MDNRNYNITHKVFDVLNNIKGFDVAMGNPQNGKLIVRYNGVSFYINIEPIFNDNEEGANADKVSFDEIVKTHSWIFK